jgi:hypothetical protein
LVGERVPVGGAARHASLPTSEQVLGHDRSFADLDLPVRKGLVVGILGLKFSTG